MNSEHWRTIHIRDMYKHEYFRYVCSGVCMPYVFKYFCAGEKWWDRNTHACRHAEVDLHESRQKIWISHAVVWRILWTAHRRLLKSRKSELLNERALLVEWVFRRTAQPQQTGLHSGDFLGHLTPVQTQRQRPLHPPTRCTARVRSLRAEFIISFQQRRPQTGNYGLLDTADEWEALQQAKHAAWSCVVGRLMLLSWLLRVSLIARKLLTSISSLNEAERSIH